MSGDGIRGGTFAIVPHWLVDALKDDGQGTNALLVYITLHRWTNGADGACWPSRRKVADAAGLSVSSVARGLARLVEIGAVTVEPRFSERGDRTSSIYEVRHDRPSAAPRTTGDTTPRVTADTAPRTTADTGTRPRLKQTQVEVPPSFPAQLALVEPTTVEAMDQTEALFDRFWTVYPRKVGKPDARRAFKAAVKRASLPDIGTGLRRWVEHWAERDEPQFVPHPSTWLNQERWNDEPPRGRSAAQSRPLSQYERLYMTRHGCTEAEAREAGERYRARPRSVEADVVG